MIIKIVGSRVDYEYGYGGYSGKTTNVNEVIATFDCEKDAKLYINDSRLKNPLNVQRPFKKKSLLSLFEFATIEVRSRGKNDPPPHNPEVVQFKKF